MTSVSVQQRLLHGLGALFYGQSVAIFIQLAGVPILLHAWGTRLYGEWLILFAIPSYLSTADLGFSLSAANDMTARNARGDAAGTLAVFQSLAILVYTAAMVGMVAILLLLWLLPLSHWMSLRGLSTTQVRWILALLAAEVLIKLIDGVNHAGFRSHGDYGLHVVLTSTTLIAQFSAIWIVALLGGGLLPGAAVFLLIRAVVTPGVAFWMLRRHPGLRLGIGHARRAMLGPLIKPALANVSTPLAMALNVQGIVLVVGAALGPLSVVTFVTLRTLSRLISQTAWRVSHAFEPELAAAWGAQDKKLLRTLYEKSLSVGFWLALPLSVGLLVFGKWMLRVWTHGKVPMNAVLFDWLLISALVSGTWYGSLNLLKSMNAHLHAALWYVFCSAGAVALAAILLHFTRELADVGIPLVAVDLLMAFFLWRPVARILDTHSWGLARAILDCRPMLDLVLSGRIFRVAR